MNFRRATPADFELLCGLLKHYSFNQRDLLKRSLLEKGRFVHLLCEIGGTVTGVLIADVWFLGKMATVNELFVNESMRERGVATALKRAFEKFCESNGVTHIVGYVNERNVAMRKVNEKLNYDKSTGIFGMWERELP